MKEKKRCATQRFFFFEFRQSFTDFVEILKNDVLFQTTQNKCKMMAKTAFFAFIFLLSTSCVFSQSTSARAHTSATVVEPIIYTKSIDLNFASMSIVVAGSVELVPKDFRVSPSNITLPVTMGTFTAVSFVVSGTTAYTYKITVPSSPMEVTSGNNTWIARSLDTDPMLYSDSELLAGVFVSFSPMNVTVNYN